MKVKMLAFAAALASAFSVCAANVSVYGSADAYIAVNNDSGNVSTVLSSGGSSGNYFGFKGSEDLYAGTQAVFKLAVGSGSRLHDTF